MSANYSLITTDIVLQKRVYVNSASYCTGEASSVWLTVSVRGRFTLTSVDRIREERAVSTATVISTVFAGRGFRCWFSAIAGSCSSKESSPTREAEMSPSDDPVPFRRTVDVYDNDDVNIILWCCYSSRERSGGIGDILTKDSVYICSLPLLLRALANLI